MDYKKIYDNLIKKAQERENNLEYYEVHHIVPKSLNGTDDSSNLVHLSLREHYLAHELLVLIYPESKELACALWIMTITTLGALKKSYEGDVKAVKRMKHFLSDADKLIRVTASEYEFARGTYIRAMRGRELSQEIREKVAVKTKKAMQNKDIIKKCIAGSKGAKYYYDLKTQEVHKWFPGHPDIDLTKYAWGRGAMTEEQKKKISALSKLKKRYFIIPYANMKYTMYEDYLKCVPSHWEEKWINVSNKKLKVIITKAVRQFNINTNFQYEGKIIFHVPNKSKNFKIITPSLYEVCGELLSDLDSPTLITDLVKTMENKIEKILELNSIYLKDVLL